MTSLGREVIAILSDRSVRGIGVIASEFLGRHVDLEGLQSELDELVVTGRVKRHVVADTWFYQLEGR